MEQVCQVDRTVQRRPLLSTRNTKRAAMLVVPRQCVPPPQEVPHPRGPTPRSRLGLCGKPRGSAELIF
eukprot:6213652-Amphidinium_carterae.1